MLCRNVDLERMFRTFSTIGEKNFHSYPKERMDHPPMGRISTASFMSKYLSMDLTQKYVELTAHQVPPGTPVFRHLQKPFAPLKANSIGSLTKQALQTLGVNTNVWKPHSTRGAGVTMLKKFGMSSEEVCEVGKWKNANAFTSHYLRMGASEKVGHHVQKVINPLLVHNVSPLSSAESDLTWTTGKNDLGGNVREDEAQSNGEPTPLPGSQINPMRRVLIENYFPNKHPKHFLLKNLLLP